MRDASVDSTRQFLLHTGSDFLSKAAGKINAQFIVFLTQLVSLSVPAYFWLREKSAHPTSATFYTPSGVLYALLSGVSIGIFMVILVRIFEQKGELSYVMPLIYGGTVFLTSFLGWALFQEKISITQAAGISLIVAGLLVVAYSKFAVADKV